MRKTYEYKSGGRLLAAVLVLLALHFLLLVISLGSSAMQYGLLSRAEAGAAITDAEATANDSREATIGVVQLGVFFVLAIVFLCTLYRANANAHALGARDLEYTPGWTVGWFFIPIMNLFKPYLAVRDTWRASDPSNRDWKNNRASAMLPVWWALYLISSIVDRIALSTTSSATTLPQMKDATLVMIGAEVVGMVLTAVAALLLYRLFAMQEGRREMAGDDRPSCPSCGEMVQSTATECPVCGKYLDFAVQPA